MSSGAPLPEKAVELGALGGTDVLDHRLSTADLWTSPGIMAPF